MEVKTQIFSVPTSSGVADFDIGGWSETPVAAKFALIGTDGTDSFDNDAIIGVSFCDGTTEYSTSIFSEDNVASGANNARMQDTYCVHDGAIDGGGTNTVTGAFSSWNTGGVELTWAGSGLSGNTYQVLVTFFAGTDVSAAVDYCVAGEHYEDITFTSKLIFTATVGRTSIPSDQSTAVLSHGVCANGTNGVTQSHALFSSYTWTTSNVYQVITNDTFSGYGTNSFDWDVAVSSIDSSGFTVGGSSTDLILFLALTFDDDVDCGTTTVPTSGSIAVTDPGFTPQIVGVFGTTNTALDTFDGSTADQGLFIGEYDGTRENSISISCEDGLATHNCTSVHSSEILHFEDADQGDLIDSSAITLDSDGFDITMTTHPSTATYFTWWAVESGASAPSAITGTITTSSTVSGDGTARGMISGGAGLGADLKDAEEINDDVNWTAYGTTTIAQNGVYVNFIGGSDVRGAYIDLDATVLTSAPTDGEKYVARGVLWSESGAINVSLHGSVTGELDSEAIADGAIVRFGLVGIEETGGANNLEFSGVAASEEFNLYVYSVRIVQGSSVSGNLLGTSELSGSINTSSAVTGDIIGTTELSGTVNTNSTVSGDVINVGASFIAGTITTSSSVTADIQGNTELTGTINSSSTVSGAIQATVPITGSISTASTTTGDVKGNSELSGTISTSSAVSGDLITPDIITQNGSWVNVIAGTKSTHARVTLDTNVLTSGLTDGEKYQVRGIIWSESGAVTVALYNEDGLEDSEAITATDIERFDLTGFKTSSGDMYVTFTSFDAGEELNIFIYNVKLVQGSSVAGDIISGTPPHDYITGTITTSSTVTGAILGNTELSVTVSTSSTVSGSLQAIVPITGSISTSSTVIGDIVGTTELSGTISTDSTVTANITSRTSIEGTITTSSTVSGDLKGITELSGTVSASSAVSGDILGVSELSGSITTSSTVFGFVLVIEPISGTITTSSTVSGSLAAASELSGSITTSSTVSGTIVSKAYAVGTITTSSTVSGDIRGIGYISGSVSTSSTVVGDLIIGAEKAFITGSISTSSTVNGDLIIGEQKGWMTVTVPTSSTVQGDISWTYIKLSGVILTSTTVSGVIDLIRSIHGTITTSSTVSGDLVGEYFLSGTINGSSQVSARLIAEGAFSGLITTSSTVSGDLVIGAQKGFISGSVSTSSTVGGDLVIGAQKGWMTSTVTTSSAVQANLSRRYITLDGSISTGSTVSGDISFEQKLRGTISTESTVSGAVVVPSISGIISTASTVSGRLSALFGGTIHTSSTVSGFVKAYFRATASISTSSTVSGDLVIGAQKGWMTSTVSTSSTVSADLTIGARKRWISGSIATATTLSADLIVGRTKGWITGTISTGTTVSAGINYKVHISGSVSTISAVSGSLKGVGSITSVIATASSVVGVVKGFTELSGAISTLTTLSAVIRGTARISGSVVAGSIPAGHLVGRYELSGDMLTYSQITADVKAWGVLGGVVLGYSEIDGEIREKGVPRDWWDIVVPLDDLEGLVVSDPAFKAQAGQEIHELVFPEGEMGLWVYENNFGIPVVEDQFTGMPEEINELLIVED